MDRCGKVYFDKENGHFTFALAKNSLTGNYLLLNFTSFKIKEVYKNYIGCKFSEAEMRRIAPVSLSSSTQRFDSHVPFHRAKAVSESVFAAKFDGEQNHEINPLYLTRILKEARMQLKGDLLREFGDCI